jgi:uncharacterized protein YfaP (DUF2135 family)
MYPGAGYLDTWGYTDRLETWKQYGAHLGVYTTQNQQRIADGTATWTVLSAAGKQAGEELVEGDLIHLENGYPDGGYLDVNGRVTQNPTFAEYEGQQLLVFTSTSSDRDSGSGTWKIVASDVAALETAAEGAPVVEPIATVAPGTVQGQVTNATSGTALEGAQVCVKGTQMCATADEGGSYTIADVPAGEQVLEATAPDYVAVEQSFTSELGTAAFQNLTLSPNLATGEMRVVLTWGAYPADLDGHLWLPSTQPSHVFYEAKGALDASPHAQQDVDDEFSYGPETITIAERVAGTYNYAVGIYAGGSSYDNSEAIVRVYGPTGLLAEYTPPAGTGSWWHVFSLDGATGTLTPVNVVQAESPAPY